MGKSSPSVVYAPPPPPPPPPTPDPSQALQTQTALNEVSGAQSRLNMNLGAQLDQQNKDFFTTQDIRQTQATGAETRSTIAAQGEQDRATAAATGEQTRKTNLQQNMQQNYVMGRQRDWSQDAYRVASGGPVSSQPSSAQPGLVQ